MASRKRESAGETASRLAGVRANANAGLIIQAGMDARFANSEPMVNYRVESSETDRISFLRLRSVHDSFESSGFLFYKKKIFLSVDHFHVFFHILTTLFPPGKRYYSVIW